MPGADGRAGMAALAGEDNLDLAEFRRHLINCLPPYARPLFLRIRTNMDLTGTFKYAKTELVRQGFDPAASNDVLYFDHLESGGFPGSIRNYTSACKRVAFASRFFIRGRR